MRTIRILYAALIIAALTVDVYAGDGDAGKGKWKKLFDGKSLKGWKVLGGQGDFKVEESMIVGTFRSGVENSFLCTNREYSDFILEYDVRIDEGINSGMQIRSHVWEKDTATSYVEPSGKSVHRKWPAGKVWGYQIELDPSKRAWSGGFYEEGNRGWIVTLAENEDARNAFRANDWNAFRVKADGNHFQVWINGTLAVDTHDDLTKSGFIGMQVHKVFRQEQEGKKVCWKNIRIQKL